MQGAATHENRRRNQGTADGHHRGKCPALDWHLCGGSRPRALALPWAPAPAEPRSEPLKRQAHVASSATSGARTMSTQSPCKFRALSVVSIFSSTMPLVSAAHRSRPRRLEPPSARPGFSARLPGTPGSGSQTPKPIPDGGAKSPDTMTGTGTSAGKCVRSIWRHAPRSQRTRLQGIQILLLGIRPPRPVTTASLSGNELVVWQTRDDYGVVVSTQDVDGLIEALRSRGTVPS
jgi:hypothetical protein